MRRVLVTGSAGFIGSNFVRDLLAAERATEVIGLDALTYAGNPAATAELASEPRFRFVHGDVADRPLVRDVLASAGPNAIVHLAAESHVDRSLVDVEAFLQTNVVGTARLLDETRRYLATHPDPDFRFVHVSTDEVFGALGATGTFVESTSYAPRSPYAASKASADHFVAAFIHTFGFPAITTNCSNNYGPYQLAEKLIPRTITTALAGLPIPVYGTGANVRDWIHVHDHCAALRAVLARGGIGASYLVGARCTRTNLEVVHAICDLLDDLAPLERSHRAAITLVPDRPGHDFRYAIDPSRIEAELGWRPTIAFEDGLRRTVEWYLARR